MREILTSEISILAFTLGIYFGATLVYQKTKFALLHPVLVTIAVIIGLLLIFNVDYLIYQKGSHLIDFMLGPSVVALGYTLYTQIASIKDNLVSILTALFVGSITGIGSVLMLAKILGSSHVLAVTLAPKSVTTPIAMAISERFGGIPSMTAVVVIAIGIIGGIAGPWVLRVLKVDSKIAIGLALGASAHGLGTARAMELGAIEGAIGGLAIGIMGLMTALIAPFFLA
ncbi:MAG TPA: LrgB family protein [Prolixibacteraceae bacterium]|nr:LrgB family protein [Prolixibacteraceae bacterium]